MDFSAARATGDSSSERTGHVVNLSAPIAFNEILASFLSDLSD
jgi:hypothetical protein